MVIINNETDLMLLIISVDEKIDTERLRMKKYKDNERIYISGFGKEDYFKMVNEQQTKITSLENLHTFLLTSKIGLMEGKNEANFNKCV